MSLAKLDSFYGIDTSGGTQDHEKSVVMTLELGMLVCMNRVFSRKLGRGEITSNFE